MVSHRKALELLWKGTCDVFVKAEKFNPVNKRTEFAEEIVCSNQPCKLSFESITTTKDSGSAAAITQSAKLFLSSSISIPPGSKIVVTQNGVTRDYEGSGEPAVYLNHQEIPLQLFKGWA